MEDHNLSIVRCGIIKGMIAKKASRSDVTEENCRTCDSAFWVAVSPAVVTCTLRHVVCECVLCFRMGLGCFLWGGGGGGGGGNNF